MTYVRKVDKTSGYHVAGRKVAMIQEIIHREMSPGIIEGGEIHLEGRGWNDVPSV